jgi:hypothetical protein
MTYLDCGVRTGGGDKTMYIAPQPLEPYGYPIAVADRLLERDNTHFVEVIFNRDPDNSRFFPIEAFKIHDPLYYLLGNTTKELSPINSGPDLISSITLSDSIGTSTSHIAKNKILAQFPEASVVFDQIKRQSEIITNLKSRLSETNILYRNIQREHNILKRFALIEDNYDSFLLFLQKTNAGISRLKSSGLIMPTGLDGRE